ncbi:bifunctional demethylmenaquinone methyltransferase/2-methoxy-6-polyprenyl-1,4-benzoquinol methylase UbiE [Ammoniphilus sp. CFH 90114]|uniref:bifunctional demethylmenaquinone methyltransferase/2-methoxy-6-polyprenyl-1,4-benzoquinol methylase UbiE n=1 Tax=Ammoniphilus sp. CFH 90114 TaxID=2493665 RepID=UPI00100FB707|nr:bifunctional demethylmenaquinone methyltransferase/2-methoxy-6-polyprenyl-1,4-benzoquinol methylase UbiE [Ammoniphilus sp. CFH 90114]RXT13568.1 bifunctional demethylmenaquinone methyltransferase/2-methoxy-6-polyprenyl-1,4-benzoquinol methylase UbiE [Ammoniphilus sp. CFH 90114]
MSYLPSKDKKESYVRDLFNTISTGYDRTNRMMSMGQDERWRRMVVARSEASKGDHILDVCCGTAKLSMQLATSVGPEGRVTGLDFSENMIEVGKQNILSHPHKDIITLIQGNAMSLPFEDNQFDAVTVAWGLRNVPDIEVAISEMVRVLKPGGKLVSLDMSKPNAPVFKQVYWLYFEKIVPVMGQFGAGKANAYHYFYESAKEFPDARKLTSLFAKKGLQETKFKDLMGGTLAIVEGRK